MKSGICIYGVQKYAREFSFQTHFYSTKCNLSDSFRISLYSSKFVFHVIQLDKIKDTPKLQFLFFNSSLAACGGTVDQVFFEINLEHSLCSIPELLKQNKHFF